MKTDGEYDGTDGENDGKREVQGGILKDIEKPEIANKIKPF